MKKTVSISIDVGVLESAREGAWELRKSFSQFVEDALRVPLPIREDQSVIEQTAEKLNSKIETKKGKDNFFNPVSKDRQLGKRK